MQFCLKTLKFFLNSGEMNIQIHGLPIFVNISFFISWIMLFRNNMNLIPRSQKTCWSAQDVAHCPWTVLFIYIFSGVIYIISNRSSQCFIRWISRRFEHEKTQPIGLSSNWQLGLCNIDTHSISAKSISQVFVTSVPASSAPFRTFRSIWKGRLMCRRSRDRSVKSSRGLEHFGPYYFGPYNFGTLGSLLTETFQPLVMTLRPLVKRHFGPSSRRFGP